MLDRDEISVAKGVNKITPAVCKGAVLYVSTVCNDK